MSDELKTRRRAVDKKDRVPMGGFRTKLQLSQADQERFKERGYVVRWVNDQHGRVEAALQAGYTFVHPEQAPSMGAMALHQENTDLNSKVSKVVSRGSEVIRAYLMEIKKEWYDEDQLAKEERNAQTDARLRSVNDGGESIEGGYTPK